MGGRTEGRTREAMLALQRGRQRDGKREQEGNKSGGVGELKKRLSCRAS